MNLNVVKDNPTGNLLLAGFHTTKTLTDRYAGEDVSIVATTSKSLPNAFSLPDWELSGVVLKIKSVADRYYYHMSSDAVPLTTGYDTELPNVVADGSTKVALTIQKKDADGGDLATNPGDNDVLDIKSTLGTMSGNINEITLSGGYAETNITAPSVLTFGEVKVKDSTDAGRNGNYPVQAS